VVDTSSLARLCGHLVIGGFEGTEVPASFARALASGERGGAILFKRNVGTPLDVARLNARLRGFAAADAPPLIAVDQEGGRVARLGPPLLVLPPMRALAGFATGGDAKLVHEAARAQAEELAALGFTMNFAPVLDVNSCATNPVIGDRAFGDEPRAVETFGIAFARGLEAGGVLACGKHFPGHGDTTKDSHLDLPVVAQPRARLDAVELPPFRAAVHAGIAALMTAHVVYPALDPGVPATLSRAICTDLARGELGFRGWLVSDDLEMKAIADRIGIEEAATRSIDAGCDALLVCHDEELQARAHEALVRRAERDPAFRARCSEAAERGLTIRRRVPPRPVSSMREIEAAGARARIVAERLAQGRV
jgi:beta-N-acetylhexosaminidase